jgi:amino acid adenylation domain-containing protein
MLAQDFVHQAAARVPGKLALIDGSHRLSYAEVVAAAGRLAAALQHRGIERGDRVLIFLPNGVDLVIAALAVLEAGAVFVPLHPQTKAAKLGYILRDTEAQALVTHANLEAIWRVAAADSSLRLVVVAGGDTAPSAPGARATLALAEALATSAPLRPAGTIDLDLAAIIYTSGTTGQPKGVMLSHRNMVSATRSVSQYLSLREDDVIACVLPMCFSYGLYQPLLAAVAGATVLIEAGFTFPVRTLENMQRERATVFPAVPAVYAALLGLHNLERFDLSSLRLMTNAAAPLPVPQLQEIRRRFPAVRFYSMYGQTECKRISYLEPDEVDRHPASVGRGMPNQELFLASEDGTLRRATGEGQGELVVRGSHVMMGYWRKPEETAAKLRDGLYPGEKVLYTGDLFRTDAEGFLHFVARQDDIIKSRGEKVSPREVENVLHELAGVTQAAVVGVPDPLLGEAVKAYIVRAPQAAISEKDVIKYCLARLENYMVPKHVAFVDSLPMTSSGKVNKSELKQNL